MVRPFKAAALQFRIDMGAVDANAERAFILLRQAAKQGASLAVLPEMWSTGFAYDRLADLSDTTPGLLRRLQSFASERRMVIAGSLPERAGKSVWNTLYVINRNGAISGQYRKAHLFQPSGEHLHFRRGTSAEVSPTDLKHRALSATTCGSGTLRKYFLGKRPPLRERAMAVRPERPLGALNTARAVENQLFVVAANAVGASGHFRFSGGSPIVSPLGERLAFGGEDEGLAIAVVDLSQAVEFRRRIPCALDRNVRAYRTTRRKR